MPEVSRSLMIKIIGVAWIGLVIMACDLVGALMATATPLPTETPLPSSTPIPTATPTSTATPTATRRPTRTPTARPRFPSATPTSSTSCRPWSAVSLSDVGDSFCVWGDIWGAWWDSNQGAFFITFNNQANSFYIVSYGWYFEVGQGDCVEAFGRIDRIGNSPVMVVEAYNDLYYCH